MSTFLAFDQASRRGRFVVNDTAVIDRTYDITTDITGALSAKGFVASPTGEFGCSGEKRLISGDGKVVLAPTVPAPGDCMVSYVAVTGWEPMARVTATASADQSKLLVNVDPDMGSGYWTLRVQSKRADGSWQTLRKIYQTRGSAETRTIDLGPGLYRVRVNPKYGYRAVASPEASLTS